MTRASGRKSGTVIEGKGCGIAPHAKPALTRLKLRQRWGPTGWWRKLTQNGKVYTKMLTATRPVMQSRP